jgi:beta-glucosidase
MEPTMGDRPMSTDEDAIASIVASMTLDEKIGQMTLVNGGGGWIPEELADGVRSGRVGAVLNDIDVAVVNELQRLAVEESRLGIPLLIGRDVIHGFRTVFPIPLGQAAAWHPQLVEQAARVAAHEAAASGVNWTFAPMIDVSRDPRWGRIAESLGEDPVLAGALGAAMVRGFQGEALHRPGAIAACAKHFAGYGTSESGRDYNSTNVPLNELRNVYLPPFQAAVAAGAASLMTSFSDIDGIPATAHTMLLRDILRGEWDFDGFVVSDWDSVHQLQVHGLTENDLESAAAAIGAGVDMEMASSTYASHLPALLAAGRVSIEQIDAMVANILRIKRRLGLFDSAHTDPALFPPIGAPAHLATAYEAAVESLVLLKNDHHRLPLNATELDAVAVIGPLADDGYQQLGTWTFDGDASLSRTCLAAIREVAEQHDLTVHAAPGVASTLSRARDGFAEAVEAAARADAVIMMLGEDAILSGEAHCRADIRLPGAQEALIDAVADTGKPIVLVVMAGRPLVLAPVLGIVDAVLYAWHPGSMGGPAIADVLFGRRSPTGKLPVTFPRMVGQVPIYYAHKHTGRPPTDEQVTLIDDIDPRAPQLSVGNVSYHLDAGASPQFPFGFGLSYTSFGYDDIVLNCDEIGLDDTLEVSASVTNTGHRTGTEIVQLYVRDLVGSLTRPVRELKGFRRVTLQPGESQRVSFRLDAASLAFYTRDGTVAAEPGEFHVWIGGSAEAELQAGFRLTAATGSARS